MAGGRPTREIRLNKFLSEAGVASRRSADRMILEGRVAVNGVIVDELGAKLDPGRDTVKVDGRSVRIGDRAVYIMLHKPPGYLVTLSDPFKRPTVRDLIPAGLGRLFPVGRLDAASEGLLLLTNDGELAYRLSHPSYEVRKTYLVKVRGEPTEEALRRLAHGIWIDGKKRAPARVDCLSRSPKSSWLRVELHEGRKHEIRLMCRAIGHDVLKLRRVGYAGLGLKALKPGEWRHLELSEVRRLRDLVGLER